MNFMGGHKFRWSEVFQDPYCLESYLLWTIWVFTCRYHQWTSWEWAGRLHYWPSQISNEYKKIWTHLYIKWLSDQRTYELVEMFRCVLVCNSEQLFIFFKFIGPTFAWLKLLVLSLKCRKAQFVSILGCVISFSC